MHHQTMRWNCWRAKGNLHADFHFKRKVFRVDSRARVIIKPLLQPTYNCNASHRVCDVAVVTFSDVRQKT